MIETAQVASSATIGQACSIWDYAQIREGATPGDSCIIRRGAHVDAGMTLGDNYKVQNYASAYEPAQLADRVLTGPAAVLTNDRWSRAIDPDGTSRTISDWKAVGVTVGHGTATRVRAVCVAPVAIGTWATVAAGTVVTTDVPEYVLVVEVPARRIGWVGRAGVHLIPCPAHERLAEDPERAPRKPIIHWKCPATGGAYTQHGETLILGPQ